MIVDRLENAVAYQALGHRIAAALDYLRGTDFSTLPEGRHYLDDDRLFAIVQRYQPKPLSKAVWEAHRKYVDVQYVFHGAERIGYAAAREDTPLVEPYNGEKDLVLYDVLGDFFELQAGSFAIFGPQDIHAPGLVAKGSSPDAWVHKVVVKCRVPA
jgi:biofilm protein TabA